MVRCGGGDLRVKGKRRNKEIVGDVFEMGTRGGVGLYGEDGIIKREIKGMLKVKLRWK